MNLTIKTLNVSGRTYSNHTPLQLLEKGVPGEDVVSAVHEHFAALIDKEAGLARAAFVSPGSLIEHEYQLAKAEATAWLEAGKPEGEVPTCVQDHVEMYEVSAEEAAQAIVDTAAAWEQAMREIRTLRLAGKTAVRKAETIEAAEQAAEDAIAQLKQYRPPAE